MNKYRLFALPYTAETMKEAERERFVRATADYILIYTNKRKKPENCAEITENEVYRLTGPETMWLYDCNVALILEETRKNAGAVAQNLSDRLDELEAALKRQRENERRAVSENERTTA